VHVIENAALSGNVFELPKIFPVWARGCFSNARQDALVGKSRPRNKEKAMKHSKMNLQTALLFAALALPTLVVPAFAQQEVDPSWYNPWATTSKATADQATTKKTAKKTSRSDERQASNSKPRSRKQLASAAQPPKGQPETTRE
jgi:hypothetical protein